MVAQDNISLHVHPNMHVTSPSSFYHSLAGQQQVVVRRAPAMEYHVDQDHHVFPSYC